MLFDEAFSYLLSLGHETLSIKLGLANTETLLESLGNPQKDFRAVQIAGTNGKGSTAAFLDSICRQAGIHTGLFTSPHLISITERIKINGEQISEAEFARLTNTVREAATTLVKRGVLQTLPTFFEHVTAIALLAFREAKVELAILETGLGGRLDSTTTAQAEVVAITPVAMDHEEYLGSTIAEIAAEKAAIIRAGVTAVIGPQTSEALDVIIRRCEAQGVQPTVIGTQTLSQLSGMSSDGRCQITIQTTHGRYENVRLGLRGRHQIDNAVVAVSLSELLGESGFPISRDAIVRGLETANHPGRLELWDSDPPVLFDGAHNPAAARALRDYLDQSVKSPVTMIFGAMKEKRLQEMARLLFPMANKLILTEIDNVRAASLQELIKAVPPGFDQNRIRTASSVDDALKKAREITPDDGLICITGSLYLIGAAQTILNSQSGSAKLNDFP
jgi:dihydrofolate synthase / folylpolyglutamate synthase